MKFLVWHESDDETDAKALEATNERQAAYDFARDNWTSDDGDTMCLVVLDPAGAVHDVEVEVGWEPTFSVSKATTRDPDDDRPTQPQDAVVLDVPHEGAL